MTTNTPISLTAPFGLDTHHFVGYHDVCPWSLDNRWLLAHAATLEGGLPGPDEEAVISIVENPPDGAFGGHEPQVVGVTRAWNWQLGARAQWLPGANESLLIFNRRTAIGFDSAIVETSGEVRGEVPFPVYAVSPDGRLAAFVDFARLHRLREGYGYPLPHEPGSDDREDGLRLGDLDTRRAGLLFAHREIAREINVPDFDRAGPPWIEHPTFSPNGDRIAFLFRARTPDGGLPTRLVVTDPDGSTAHSPELTEVTHYAWLDDDQILAWGRDPGSPAGRFQQLGVPDVLMRLARALSRRFPTGPVRERVVGDCFRVVDLAAGTVEPFLGALSQDGHPAPRPRSEMVLLDTYPDADGRQQLYLVDPTSEQRVELGRWATQRFGGVNRCDLHPRWDRAGRRICVDSGHGGRRGVYVADLTTTIKELETRG